MRYAITLGLISLVTLSACGGGAAAEEVEFRSGEATLKAVLFKPEGPGPFPAIVGLHGCNGLINRAGQLGTRYRDWGERLVAAGFVVLYPDSFGSRGITSQCTVRERRVRSSRERVMDANAARRWLQGKEWVRPDRVAIV